MVIVMKPEATEEQLKNVLSKIEELGYKPHVIYGATRNVIGAVGDERGKFVLQSLEVLDGVEAVIPILKPYKLASREIKKEKTVINVSNVSIGGNDIVVIAGPCAVENEEQIINTALAVKKAGADILRGGAYKPRTSPYTFQGLGEEGLRYLKEAGEAFGLITVTEVVDQHDAEFVAAHADVLQIGARNMQNYALLTAVGRLDVPVLLKRGPSATIDEWLLAAEYVLHNGNQNVILCERGVHPVDRTYTRYTLDISAVPVIKSISHLPVIIDPSHAAGNRTYVPALSYAAVAAGADGLLVEVHPDPAHALCDGPQALSFDAFSKMMRRISRIKSCADDLFKG